MVNVKSSLEELKRTCPKTDPLDTKDTNVSYINLFAAYTGVWVRMTPIITYQSMVPR